MDPVALYESVTTTDREYLIQWTAVELLLTDAGVQADPDLYDRLSKLQEQWESAARKRHGVMS